MLLHCVFLRFADTHGPEARRAVLRALGEIRPEVDGMLDYRFGRNLDFEGKSPDHREGFVVTFRDRDAHLAYERHPRHAALGARLVDMCVGGADGIVVYDLEVG